jgi:hypothetical protein
LYSPSLVLPLKEGEDEKSNFLPLLFFLPSSPFLRGRIKVGVFVPPLLLQENFIFLISNQFLILKQASI